MAFCKIANVYFLNLMTVVKERKEDIRYLSILILLLFMYK